MKKSAYILAMALLLSSAAKANAAGFEGAFFGLQLGDTHTTEKVNDNLFFQGTNPGAPVSYDINPRGVTAGILGGYRVKLNNFILGIEANGSLSNSRSPTYEYDDGGGHITDTQFFKRGTLTIGPKFGYLLTDKLMGFVGADYALGQFKSREVVDGVTAASCSAGTCPNGNYLMQGIGFGGGLEMIATDAIHMRVDYEHTSWQSKTFTDSSGNTAKIAPNDDAVRVAVIYAFK